MDEIILLEVEEKMKESITTFENDLSKIRTGRANPVMLESVTVMYYGAATPLTQMANVTAPEPRQLLIKPYDPAGLKDIVLAITKSDLELQPEENGGVIRINIPPLTEETRKEKVKKVHQVSEEAKIRIRNSRREGNDKIKKSDEFTEDMSKQLQEDVQKLTDTYVKKIDSLVEKKEKDLMTI